MRHSPRVEYYIGLRRYNPKGARPAVTRRTMVRGRPFCLNADGTTKWYGVDEGLARLASREKNRFKQTKFTIKSLEEMEELIARGDAKVFGDVATMEQLRPIRGTTAQSAKPTRARRNKPLIGRHEKAHPAAAHFEYDEPGEDEDDDYSNPFEGEPDHEAETAEILRRANSSAPVVIDDSDDEPDEDDDSEPEVPVKRARSTKKTAKKTTKKKTAKKTTSRRRRSAEA